MIMRNYYSYPFIAKGIIYPANQYVVSQASKLIIFMLPKNTEYKQEWYAFPCKW